MPVTYKLIASVTVGSGGLAEIEFTSIPATYTDLALHLSLRDGTQAAVLLNCRLEINSAGTFNTTNRWLRGSGSAVASGSGTNISILYPGTSATASTFGNAQVYFPNYSNTSVKKSFSVDCVTENNATEAYTWLAAGLYDFNTAISSISINADTSNVFAQHSTATLYGISNS